MSFLFGDSSFLQGAHEYANPTGLDPVDNYLVDPWLNPLLGIEDPEEPVDPLAAGRPTQAMITSLRNFLVNNIVPARQNAMLSSIRGNQALANGSPMAILGQTAGQAGQMTGQARQAQRQAAQQLGPYGGGQMKRTNEQISGNLLPALAKLFASASMKGQQGLFDIATGTSQLIPAAERSSSNSTTQPDPNTMGNAYALMGLTNLGIQGIKSMQQSAMPSQYDMASGMSPFY